MWAGVRTLRYADVSTSVPLLPLRLRSRLLIPPDASTQGPDEVHLDQLGRTELKRVPAVREKYARVQKREEELTKNSHTGSKL